MGDTAVETDTRSPRLVTTKAAIGPHRVRRKFDWRKVHAPSHRGAALPLGGSIQSCDSQCTDPAVQCLNWALRGGGGGGGHPLWHPKRWAPRRTQPSSSPAKGCGNGCWGMRRRFSFIFQRTYRCHSGRRGIPEGRVYRTQPDIRHQDRIGTDPRPRHCPHPLWPSPQPLSFQGTGFRPVATWSP